ncbi:MAG: hypothetical protein CMP67_10400 [Flavobacteriales bacterium]|nr:hypothetical protein [Flavobacteriales bacterium]|tara:strand:+ start:12766 stop:13797 length:1032 start_codon:yes stop_codon:yes gene_type:complete
MKYTKILQLGLCLAFFYGCNPIEKVGPDICPSDDFSLTSEDLIINVLSPGVTQSLEDAGGNLDLTNEGLNIKSNFGEEVDWTLKISNGTQEKNFSGTGESFNVYWYGQPDKFDGTKMQFDEGSVTVKLSVVCHDAVSKTFQLTGTQNFSTLDSNFGVLLRDWDQNGAYPVNGVTYDPINQSDGWSGKGGGVDVWELQYYNTTPSPAGGLYAQLSGSGENGMWYLGSHSFTLTNFSDLLPTQNVDSLYVNIFASAEEGAINTGSQIAVKNNGKSYLGLENINWTGWKLLSYKMSDLKTTSGDNLPSANITDFVLQLGAAPEPSNDLKVKYDFVLITVGAPLFSE